MQWAAQRADDGALDAPEQDEALLHAVVHVEEGRRVEGLLQRIEPAGISGSSTADVAVLARTVGPEMAREGYDKAFVAALIASASTIANLIPPSIMAVVYGATGNVSIGGLFLGGVVPGVLVGLGLMIYSRFFGPPGTRRPRATFGQFSEAAKPSALPLVIPIIIMGGILSGFFTPTEAGLVAVAYIVFVLVPIINRGHIKNLPRDFANAGLLYSIPLVAVAAASAFGWMLAYLRGPDVVAGWIASTAGPNPLFIMSCWSLSSSWSATSSMRRRSSSLCRSSTRLPSSARSTRCTWAWSSS